MDRLQWLLGTEMFPGRLAFCVMVCCALLARPGFAQSFEMTQVLAEAEDALVQRDLDVALDRFQLAQHMIHIEHGVLSARQNPILEQMALIHLTRGSFSEANKLMEFQHRVVSHSSNFSPEALAPSWQTLGRWYQQTLQPKKSQAAFRQALSLTKQHSLPRGEIPDIQLGMLRNEHMLVKCCDIESALAELEGLSLSEAQWLELGDLAMLARKHKQAAEFYAQSQATVSATPIGVKRIDHLARTYVQASLERQSRLSVVAASEMTPTQLIGAPLPLCESRVADVSGSKDYSDFKLDLEFTVNVKGSVRSIKVLDGNAPSSIRALVRKQLSGTVYRPSLVQGEVQKSEVQLQQQFDRLAERVSSEKRIATQLSCVAAARALESDVLVARVR